MVREEGDEVDLGALRRGEAVHERADSGGEVRFAKSLDGHNANTYFGRGERQREDGGRGRGVLREELKGLRFAVDGVDGLVGGGIKKVRARVAGEEEATVNNRKSEGGKEAEEDSERLHYCVCLRRISES